MLSILYLIISSTSIKSISCLLCFTISEIKPIITGIIISNGEEAGLDLEKITLNYDRNIVYRYGTYLPNFLNYEFLVMKKTK